MMDDVCVEDFPGKVASLSGLCSAIVLGDPLMVNESGWLWHPHVQKAINKPHATRRPQGWIDLRTQFPKSMASPIKINDSKVNGSTGKMIGIESIAGNSVTPEWSHWMEEPWLIMVWRQTIILYNGFTGKAVRIWTSKGEQGSDLSLWREAIRLPSIKVLESSPSKQLGGETQFGYQTAKVIELGVPVKVWKRHMSNLWRFNGFEIRLLRLDLEKPAACRDVGRIEIPLNNTLAGMCHPLREWGNPENDSTLVYWEKYSAPRAIQMAHRYKDDVANVSVYSFPSWEEGFDGIKTLTLHQEQQWRNCHFFTVQSGSEYRVLKLVLSDNEISIYKFNQLFRSPPAGMVGFPMWSSDQMASPEAFGILDQFLLRSKKILIQYDNWQLEEIKCDTSSLGVASWKESFWTIGSQDTHDLVEYRLTENSGKEGQKKIGLKAYFHKQNKAGERSDKKRDDIEVEQILSPPILGPGYVVAPRMRRRQGVRQTYLSLVSQHYKFPDSTKG